LAADPLGFVGESANSYGCAGAALVCKQPAMNRRSYESSAVDGAFVLGTLVWQFTRTIRGLLAVID
jgi:hypothetical protein